MSSATVVTGTLRVNRGNVIIEHASIVKKNHENLKKHDLLRTYNLTPLHSERPKLYAMLAFLSAIGLMRTIHAHTTYRVQVQSNLP